MDRGFTSVFPPSTATSTTSGNNSPPRPQHQGRQSGDCLDEVAGALKKVEEDRPPAVLETNVHPSRVGQLEGRIF